MSDTHDASTIAVARPDEWADAFQLLFARLDGVSDEWRAANAVQLIGQGDLDPAGLLVARRSGTIVGAIVFQLSPGAGSLIWPPRTRNIVDSSATEDQLVESAEILLRQRGARVCQALLSTEELPLGAALTRHGFRHTSALWYMRHNLKRWPNYTSPGAELSFETFADADRAVFESTLERTYENSADCPELNGVRTMGEIIAGHQAQGRFDPRRWWLVREQLTSVGILLLSEVPELHSWDLAYFGVVPQARRRGIGRVMAIRGLTEAREAKQLQLTLAVDVRNQAAWKLYRGLGFQAVDRKEIFLRVW